VDEVLGVELLVRDGGGADVARDGEHLLEALPLVEVLGEAETRARDAGEGLGPAEQVLSGRRQTAHRGDPSDHFGRTAHRASASLSPVRMRTTRSTSVIQILPSPSLPVRAAAAMTSAMRPASIASTSTSTRTFGTKSIVYSAPRYTSVCPDCWPNPRTSVTVMPAAPASVRAAFTSSSLWGLM